MHWLEVFATALVWLGALWLFALGLLSALAPAAAARFLAAFARTRRAHFVEQILRIVAGLAFWQHAGNMLYTNLFQVLGAVLVGTSVALLLLPWRWHRRFAELVVPTVQRHLKLYALAAFATGIFVVHALVAKA